MMLQIKNKRHLARCLQRSGFIYEKILRMTPKITPALSWRILETKNTCSSSIHTKALFWCWLQFNNTIICNRKASGTNHIEGHVFSHVTNFPKVILQENIKHGILKWVSVSFVFFFSECLTLWQGKLNLDGLDDFQSYWHGKLETAVLAAQLRRLHDLREFIFSV